MMTKLLNASYPKTYAVVFENDDEAIAGLNAFAASEALAASQITGIGAVREAVLGYFDWDRKSYRRIPVREQCEVVSLVGDVTCGPEGRQLHLHVVLARADGAALGGHLLAAFVRPTLEVIVTESPGYLQRRVDPETKIALIRF